MTIKHQHNIKKLSSILILLFLSSLAPWPPAHAGKKNVSGDLSGETYWTDEQRAEVEARTFRGLWWALGESDRDLFPNIYRGLGAVASRLFSPFMERNVWTPMAEIPPDPAGPNPYVGYVGDDLVAMGVIGAGRWGKAMGRIGDDLAGVTAALPRAVNPSFAPEYRSAPNWIHNRDAWVAAAKAGNMEGMATAKANSFGDLIKTINYSNSRHAAIQLERMAEVGKHNFVIVIRGSRMELRVANPRGMMSGLGREYGVKHIQLANGRPIIAGGTMNVSRSLIGEPIVRIMNDTGTYGPRMLMTPERIETMTKFVYDAFGWQVPQQNIIFESFNP